ncbi:MAG: rod shape-determining protein MreD [Firmicutes bacterium]|nr:rod shape-determining protein MreD [Bacillota bacterium]
MKYKALVMGLLAIVLLCLESTVLHYIKIYGIIPNLTLCMVVSCSLLFGSTFGRRLGLVIGLIQDVLFLDVLGFFTLLYFLLGQIAGLFKNGFDQNNLLLSLGLTALFDLLFSGICYLFFHFFQGRIDVMYFLTSTILPELIYTLIASIPVYFLVRYLGTLLDRFIEQYRHQTAEGTMPIDVRSEKTN